jgi:hypothetical protein
MRTTYLVGLLLTLALVAGACTRESDLPSIASLEPDSANPPAASEDTNADRAYDSEAAMLAFTQCLRDQGIDVGDPTIDADGNLQLPPIEFDSSEAVTDPDELPDISELEDKIAPCEEHLEGIVGSFDPGDTTEIEDMFLAYAECMRENGVDMPDPDFSSGGGVIDLGAIGGDTFEAADEACRPLLADLGIVGS